VNRRTVHRALASPQPAPRKKHRRRASRLDPFKDTIDALLADPDTPGGKPPTAKRIFDRLVTEHGMQHVSYSTVCHYVRSRRAAATTTATVQDAP
jgi:hypothetical protein